MTTGRHSLSARWLAMLGVSAMLALAAGSTSARDADERPRGRGEMQRMSPAEREALRSHLQERRDASEASRREARPMPLRPPGAEPPQQGRPPANGGQERGPRAMRNDEPADRPALRRLSPEERRKLRRELRDAYRDD